MAPTPASDSPPTKTAPSLRTVALIFSDRLSANSIPICPSAAKGGVLVNGTEYGTNSSLGVDKSAGLNTGTDIQLGSGANETLRVSFCLKKKQNSLYASISVLIKANEPKAGLR